MRIGIQQQQQHLQRPPAYFDAITRVRQVLQVKFKTEINFFYICSEVRRLQRGMQEFNRKYVWVPGDKAANNLVMV